MNGITLFPIKGMPEVSPGSDLPLALLQVLKTMDVQQGDILVVTHKVVSKANGLIRSLSEVTYSEEAETIAQMSGKDPRLVQVILDCSERLYSCERGILISARRDGWICCNAGVDASNAGAKDHVIILPEDNDRHAQFISEFLSEALGLSIPVIICDTHGRVLRQGAVGVAVGSWGIDPIKSYIGEVDRDGRVLRSSKEAIADEISGAATLVMGQGKEGIPAVLLRGYDHVFEKIDSSALKRRMDEQLFKVQGEEFIQNDK